MRRTGVVLLVALTGCTRSPNPRVAVARSSVSRVLEISAAYHFPPGALLGYTVREEGGRVEAYAYDLRDSTKHVPLQGDPRLVRFIDRVDSLITYRLPSDTNRAPPPRTVILCGDGSHLGARLTVGSAARTVGAGMCEDRSPGSGSRRAVLEGIIDSLRQLARP
jgi:hypothetical protein